MERDSGGPTFDSQALAIAVQDRPSAIVITASGEVDLLTAPQLRAAVEDAISKLGSRRLVLNLVAVTFFGSPGLQILVAAATDLQRDGGDTALRVVTGATHAVLRPVEIAGLDGLLRLCETADEALDT